MACAHLSGVVNEDVRLVMAGNASSVIEFYRGLDLMDLNKVTVHLMIQRCFYTQACAEFSTISLIIFRLYHLDSPLLCSGLIVSSTSNLLKIAAW